jgi:hypothetical protein
LVYVKSRDVFPAVPRKRGVMSWYSFFVSSPDGSSQMAGSTNLPDDDAARRYGHLIVRELRQRGHYDPKTKLVVRNGSGDTIPFGD